MHLTIEDLTSLIQKAKKAALAAGKIIANTNGANLELKHKVAGENIASSVVTQLDHDAQSIILEILYPTLKQYDLGLLTEESTDDNSRLEKDYFWCIDPLDGTLAFSRNEDGYSTSIALVSKKGDPIIGVVFNPRTRDLYFAIKGNGAFKNASKFHLKKSENNYLTLLYDQSFLKLQNYDSEIDLLKRNASELGFNEVKLVHLGGAVMNGISTIEFAPAIYYKHPKKSNGGGSIWDFAASSVIQSEAGGYNSDYHHRPLDLNRVDSTFMNHKGAMYSSSESFAKRIVPSSHLKPDQKN